MESNFHELIECLKDSTISEENNTKLTEWFNENLKCNQVPILNKSSDSPYDELDFPNESLIKVVKKLQFLHDNVLILINKSKNCKGKLLLKKSADALSVCCIGLAAQYHDKGTFWSSSQASQSAEALLHLLLTPDSNGKTNLDTLYGKNLEHQLQEKTSNNTLYILGFALKPVLQFISNNLQQKNWKNDPGTREIYLWLMKYLPSSTVSAELGVLLPGALLLVDDWEPRHKIAGLDVLHRLVIQLPGSELRCFGRADVIHAAARHHLYSRDPLLLDAAYPVVIQAAAVKDRDPANTAALVKSGACEECLCQLLREMCYEQRLDLRAVYARHLAPAIAATGLTALRWSNEVVEVIINYLETYEGEHAEDRIAILKAVQELLHQCWASADVAKRLLEALCCLVYDVTKHDANVTQQGRDSVVEQCAVCVSLLYSLQPATCRDACRAVNTATDMISHDPLTLYLNRVLASVMAAGSQS